MIKLFKPHSLTRVLGFDFFGKKQKIKNKYKDDDTCNKFHRKRGIKKDNIIKNLQKFNISNVKLISGDVCQTTKKYVKKKYWL